MLGIRWTITAEAQNHLHDLTALNLLFTKYHPQPDHIISQRRASILNSAVFSARIENIPARVEDPQSNRKQEVQNLVSAYNFVFSPASPHKLSPALIRRFHALILNHLSAVAGHWRTEPWVIFNSAGVAVYLAPAHFRLPQLIPQYVSFINSLKTPPPVSAAIAQFAFEKLHPFTDGNGRVGRLISAFILSKAGFGHVSESEKYLDEHRDLYYSVLEPNQVATMFIEFFLQALVNTAQSRLASLSSPPPADPEAKLLPRRRELLAIIRDHPLCSFDFLSRRFSSVNPKNLHYDLQSLQRTGLVIKHGVSRAVVYSSAPS